MDSDFIIKLRNILNRYYELDDNDFNDLVPFFTLKNFNKNDVVKNYHNHETEIRIILSGCIGYFIENSHNEDQCFYFAFESDFAIDYPGYLTNDIPKIKLVSLSKSILITILIDDFLRFCEKNHAGEKLMNAALEQLYLDTQREYFDLLTLQATERYLKLLQRKKGLSQKIDHKYIASYLGIAPQSLSRLRKKLCKN